MGFPSMELQMILIISLSVFSETWRKHIPILLEQLVHDFGVGTHLWEHPAPTNTSTWFSNPPYQLFIAVAHFFFFFCFFLTWTIFKVFIEFVTILLLFYVLGFWPWGMWDLSSQTRDWTCTPCIGRRSLNHWTARQVPAVAHFLNFMCSPAWII